MPQVGNLASTAQVTIPLSYTPQNLLIGDVNDVTDPTFLQVSVRGNSVISLTALARIVAFQQLGMRMLGGATASVANMLEIASGRIEQACNIIITNGQATTPAVYANSVQFSNPSNTAKGTMITAGEQTVNATDNRSFGNFLALYFLPANVDYVTVEYLNGYTENLQTEEIDALFAQNNDSDANGQLNGHTVLDARKLGIVKANIQTSSGGNCVVTRVGMLNV